MGRSLCLLFDSGSFLDTKPSVGPAFPSSPRLLDPPPHPAAGACACLRAGRLQGGGCASQACPRTRRMRRMRGGDRTVCVEVDGELSRGDAVTPSNPPPATFGGEWWEPGGCVRARAISMQAQHSRRTRRHNDTLTYTYRQRACVRCLYSARAADDLSRLMQKLNQKKKKGGSVTL